MTNDEMGKIVNELGTYVEYDVDSYSNYLVDIYEFSWCMSDNFLEVYKKEIVEQLENYKKHYDIVTEDVAYKQTYLKSKWDEK